jgi:cardiolipin synthase
MALMLLAAGGCASVPKVALPVAAPSFRPEIVTRHGPLTVEQSRAILQKLSTEPGEAGLLRRHLATEEAIAEAPLIAGNRTKLLRDGPQTFRAMFGAIAGAKRDINLEYYIFEDVTYDGQQLGDLLIAKRRAGVAIHVIYDSFGSSGTPKTFFDQLMQAGIKLVSFNPVNPLESKVAYAPNNRDHRKILVVDGQVAIIGGVNLSTAYQSHPLAKSGGATGTTQDQWRDTDLQIEGAAVAELQKLFLEHWSQQKGPALDSSAMFPANGPNGPAVVRVLGSAPSDGFQPYYVALLTAIRTAEKSVHITTAYFVPTPQEVEDLKAAAQRGVDVRLLLPGRSDSPLSIAVAHSHYGGLLEAGVEIFETHDIVLHSKTVVIDGVWSSIGSSNFDHRSVISNDEVDVVVLGSEAAQELEALFADDQAGARPIERNAWKSRPLWTRLKETLALTWEKLL